MTQLLFPPDFVWGAATAAFQIEGSTTSDGRTDSIWDAFCRRPGAIAGGDTGEPGADHYRRMHDDVGLMTELGLHAYRFSIAWPRVRPDGGVVNPAGLGFYDRLVDALLTAGIDPWITLYHWDLPQALEDRGGWANRDTAQRFADYTEAVIGALGDRVRHWGTLNEPWCSAFMGYAQGTHAPGRTEPAAAVAATHHLLLAHGLGLRVIRELAPHAQAGLALNLYPVRVADPADPADLDAARRIDGLQNRIFLDPLLRGAYPEDMLADLAPFALPELIGADDAKLIGAPLDYLGFNYYRDYFVTAKPDGTNPAHTPWVSAEHVRFPDRGLPRTACGWDVAPDGLSELLSRLHRDYPGVPLYITECGAAYDDRITADGSIADDARITFLHSHLRAAHTALAAGVDLRGFFYWSLLDNFEWAEGYAKRFGIVHVDYETQVRTPKASARWYSRVIAEHAVP
ncbi:GH1 family beta-glucosidase [Nocardia macrotermitis]|uniref:Beta-glucosidase n=1 Tax=Nocardia macrotermitis TaxID=2585198 RepID=A0A7K0D8W9_9NOCA|nr:GH1 family beta-glucosidase [Nocardia macrotermitis]MQY22220.1 Beta-glucosidase A [Nocardia macrotermitis]